MFLEQIEPEPLDLEFKLGINSSVRGVETSALAIWGLEMHWDEKDL